MSAFPRPIAAEGDRDPLDGAGRGGMKATHGIFGVGGCGRGIIPLAKAQLAGAAARVVFVDDSAAGQVVNGHPVLSLTEFVERSDGRGRIAVAVADPATRRRVVERCDAAGLSYFQVRAENTVIMDEVEIGDGALISPFVTMTSNIRIGRHFHANLYSYVEHDCVIGDFVTFAPGVRCNGAIDIGDGAYIGSGAMIRQGSRDRPLTIGAGAVVGMGAVVLRDVAPGEVVAGNPAHPLKR